MKTNIISLFYFVAFSFCSATYLCAPEAQAASEGQTIYQQNCSLCHASGLAGAPKFQNANEWNPRLAKGGISALVKNSMDGVNGVMPPKGACESCTEQQLKDAIEYMLPPK